MEMVKTSPQFQYSLRLLLTIAFAFALAFGIMGYTWPWLTTLNDRELATVAMFTALGIVGLMIVGLTYAQNKKRCRDEKPD